MKNLFASTLFVAALVLSAFTTGDITSIAIGTSLPKAGDKMKDAVSGKEITLTQSKKENGLLVVFSCNTCPYVIKHEKVIMEEAKHAKEGKIGVVVINSNEGKRADDDSFEAMKTYAKVQGYDFPYTVDAKSAFADAFGATRTPEVFLFDKNMKLVYKGAYTDDSDPVNATAFHLKNAINEVVAGKAVTVTSAKSVGCTIKRVVTPKN
jgi:thioredoxin-related protein